MGDGECSATTSGGEGVCWALDIGEGISSAGAMKGPAELDDQKENVVRYTAPGGGEGWYVRPQIVGEGWYARPQHV